MVLALLAAASDDAAAMWSMLLAIVCDDVTAM